LLCVVQNYFFLFYPGWKWFSWGGVLFTPGNTPVHVVKPEIKTSEYLTTLEIIGFKPEIKTSEYLTTLEITGLASLALGTCGVAVLFVCVLYNRRHRNRTRNDNLQYRSRTLVENIQLLTNSNGRTLQSWIQSEQTHQL
jgi:hypothetical protein